MQDGERKEEGRCRGLVVDVLAGYLAAQAYDLLILHREVLLILLDRCLVLMGCGHHLMLMQ